jgi:hypothetical protein
MSESKKSHYRQLNKEQQKLIDEQCDVFNRRIMDARPGLRDYTVLFSKHGRVFSV